MMVAAKGHHKAQYVVGTMYEQGEGIFTNLGKAFALYTESAKQNNPQAQHRLNLMYFRSRGVKDELVTVTEIHKKTAANTFQRKSIINLIY